MVRKLLTLLTGLTLMLAMGADALAARGKVLIGYVDLQKAILRVDDGIAAKAEIEAKFKSKQAEIGKSEKELLALKGKLEQKAKTAQASDPATRQEIIDYQRRVMELTQTLQAEQQKLAKLEQEKLGVITKKMRDIIKEMGRKGGYTIILEIQQNRLLYGEDHLDLTGELIRKYNKKHGK